MSGQYERELVNALRDCGFGAVRIGASGSGTDADRADIVAGEAVVTVLSTESHELTVTSADDVRSDVWIIEHKTTSANVAYADPGEVNAIRREASRWGGRPFVGVRFKGDTAHYLVAPEDCRMTPSDNFAVSQDDLPDDATVVVNLGDPPAVERC